MDFRGLLVCGIFAAIAYVVAVIFGVGIRPGYSHIGNFISELIETGAPNKGLLNPLFAIYNLLTGAFAVGLLIFIQVKSSQAATNIGNIGAIVLIADYSGATNSPISGLMERITIGGFLQWMLFLGLRLSNL